MYFWHQFWFCRMKKVWKHDVRGRLLLPGNQKRICPVLKCQQLVNEPGSVSGMSRLGLKSRLPLDSLRYARLLASPRVAAEQAFWHLFSCSLRSNPELPECVQSNQPPFLKIIYHLRLSHICAVWGNHSSFTWMRDFLMTRLTSSRHSATSGLWSSRLDEKASRWDLKYSGR